MTKLSIEGLTFTSALALVEVDPSTSPSAPMRIMLVLDPEAEPPSLYVETRYQPQTSGTPMVEWHNRRYSWELPASVDATAIKDWVEEPSNLNFFQALADDYESHWDGNNTVGTSLGYEVEHQIEQLIGELPSCAGGLWDAGDYYAAVGFEHALDDGQLNPRAAGDDELGLAAELVEVLALDEGVVLCNTREMLKRAVAEALGEE